MDLHVTNEMDEPLGVDHSHIAFVSQTVPCSCYLLLILLESVSLVLQFLPQYEGMNESDRAVIEQLNTQQGMVHNRWL